MIIIWYIDYYVNNSMQEDYVAGVIHQGGEGFYPYEVFPCH